MKRSRYVDSEGRKWAVMLPDGMSEGDANKGIPLGPPSLEPLGLPLEVEVRLHNQLFGRELFTERDVKARRQHVMGAIQATLKVDVERIVQLYRPEPEPARGGNDGKPKKVSKPRASRRRRRQGGN